jgi:hypothetical protein
MKKSNRVIKKEDQRAWRKEMDNQIDMMEDQLKMSLELFTAKRKIPDFHYNLEIKCKVKFEYE